MNAIRSDFPLIEVENVSAIIDGQSVLENVSFRTSNGERVVIMGETGSGKSSLLKLIAGIEMCETGSILVNGKKIKGPQDQLIPGNPGICYMNQHALLRNNYRVHEILDLNRTMSDNEANQLYSRIGISHLLNRWSDEVSGGEKQRVLLASLLVTMPIILLLDEPFSNLDQINKSIIKAVIDDFIKDNNISVILATHDPSDIWNWGEKLLILQNGSMIEFDAPRSIYFNPINEYVAGLLGAYQRIPKQNPLNVLFEERKSQEEIIVRSSFFVCNTIKTDHTSIEGRVVGVRFFDHYQILNVEIDHFILQVTAATNARMKCNDVVYVNRNMETV
jgi:iron(III) transport system ATP-binding protein